MSGEDLFRESEDAVDLGSILEIDRAPFLRLYADLVRDRDDVDEQHIRYAECLIDGFIDRVESILGSCRMSRKGVDRLLGCEVGRLVWSMYMDRLHEEIRDCITGYVEDLYEGKENERAVLRKIDGLVNRYLSALYHVLNDEEYLLELALVHSD